MPSLPDLPPSVPVKSDPDAVPSVAVAGAVVVAAGAVVADSSGPSPPPEKRRARDHPSSSWLDDVLIIKVEESDTMNEIERYFSEPVTEKDNCLSLWKAREMIYPQVCKAARKCSLRENLLFGREYC